MLQNTELEIEDIASACGYNDRSALNIAFKRSFNITPGNWRKCRAEKKNLAF